jgi:hypothetical protein
MILKGDSSIPPRLYQQITHSNLQYLSPCAVSKIAPTISIVRYHHIIASQLSDRSRSCWCLIKLTVGLSPERIPKIVPYTKSKYTKWKIWDPCVDPTVHTPVHTPPEKKCLSFKIARYLLCTDDDTYIEQHGGHGQKHLETTGVFFVFTVYPYKVVSETLLAAKQLELPQVMSCRLLGRRLTCAHKIDPAARTGF